MRPSGYILRSVGRCLSQHRPSPVITQPSITCEAMARLPMRPEELLLGASSSSSTFRSSGSGFEAARGLEKPQGFWQRDAALSGYQQRRAFLGVGEGGEESDRSRHHEENRLIGYSPEQLYAVVAAVDLYEDFVPWCQKSTIIWHKPNEALEAELEIGFKVFVERYRSHVKLDRPFSIKTSVSQSNLFDHLINEWTFKPGPTPNSTDLHFLVDFQFRSPLYTKVANMFFNEVAQRLVGSFEDRCKTVYGPSLQAVRKSS